MRGVKIKSGMGGSNGGRSRRMKTENLKKISKKMRRQNKFNEEINCG